MQSQLELSREMTHTQIVLCYREGIGIIKDRQIYKVEQYKTIRSKNAYKESNKNK